MVREQTAKDIGNIGTAAKRCCVGIVGAGSIGCYLGAHLCQDSALDVKFFGRDAVAIELAAYGLTVDSLEQQQYAAPAVAFYTSFNSLIECDVVLLTVKATALVSLISQFKRFLRPDVPIIAMQNGLGIAEMLQQDLANPIIRAIVPFNVVRTGAGRFYRATAGDMIWQHSALPIVGFLIAVFERFQLNISRCNDIEAAEYGKLLLNLNNAINAISNVPLREQLLQRPYRCVLAAAMQELLDVCHKSHIKPVAYTKLPNALLPWLLRLPTWLFRHLASSMLAIDSQARSSMWDDIQSHRRTEIVFLNGAVVRLGQLHQLQTPVNAMLVELVMRLEAGEQLALSPERLLQLCEQKPA